MRKIASGRFSVLYYFILWFLAMSFAIRISFFIWQHDDVSWNIIDFIRTIFTGLFFDIGTIVFVCILPVLYYVFIPAKLIGTRFDKVIVYFFTSIAVLLLVFVFLAEITFWDEFKSRFNFIAVDYLIYTFEVVQNIEQSYPLPLLLSIVFVVAACVIFLFYRRKIFQSTFSSYPSFKQRIGVLLISISICFLFIKFVPNTLAEWSANRYNAEISKSGIYSFFAAFRNNQMKYSEFYTEIKDASAFRIVRDKLREENSVYIDSGFSVHRIIKDSIGQNPQINNVVFVLMESMSAGFMKEFGNTKNITPCLDSLAQSGVFFSNLYATGTRTVRGMEAVTLCIPPTPGQSIVKRPDNANLYTISNVFRSKNYSCNFFYGGDGYFDNMNAYFGGNGFSIYDRGHGRLLNEQISAKRINIPDSEVSFENAWGICDGDIYNKMLRVADEHYLKKENFFNFIMTTSNHKPYTYPANKIDIPSGTGRDGAVKYADYALKEMLVKASAKPWFKNTVFVIIADHCASSAGKDEIDVANYHIPAFIINLTNQPAVKINKQCSQVDLFPTLFSLLHWSYESDFFGKNILSDQFEERALIGTYRKLALLKQDEIMVLSDQKKQAFYKWNKADNNLTPISPNNSFLQEAIAWYQTADYLFSNKLLK